MGMHVRSFPVLLRRTGCATINRPRGWHSAPRARDGNYDHSWSPIFEALVLCCHLPPALSHPGATGRTGVMVSSPFTEDHPVGSSLFVASCANPGTANIYIDFASRAPVGLTGNPTPPRDSSPWRDPLPTSTPPPHLPRHDTVISTSTSFADCPPLSSLAIPCPTHLLTTP